MHREYIIMCGDIIRHFTDHSYAHCKHLSGTNRLQLTQIFTGLVTARTSTATTHAQQDISVPDPPQACTPLPGVPPLHPHTVHGNMELPLPILYKVL